MELVELTVTDTSNQSALATQDILELYEAMQGELQTCAAIKPACNSSNSSVEFQESALLELEEGLLDAAARVQIRGSKDIQNLIDLWEKTSYLEDTDYCRPADRIAMNIFRHLMDTKMLID